MDYYMGNQTPKQQNAPTYSVASPKKQGGGIKGYQIAILMIVSLLVGSFLTVVLLSSVSLPGDKYDASIISDLMESIDKYYYFQDEKPDVDTMLKAAADAVIASTGDRYAEYFTDEGYDAYYDNLNGNYKGIGVLVTGDPEGRGLLVSRAYTGNPAYNAGVRDGDIITHVNGTSLAGVSLDDAADLLIGEDGSVASLTVLRGESSQTFDVVRGDVVVSRVFSERLDNGIGYICIEEFTGDAATAFNSQLQALLDDGITSLIIDIRNNPGGGLDTVIKIADRVLPDCLITTLEGQLVGPPEEYRSDDKQKLEIPYVVLVNEGSASASEVFSGAIQDNNAAPLIGTTTFGKGIVQTSWSLGVGRGMIKLTTDAYRTPSGKLIHGIGLTPDIEVQQPAELQGISPYTLLNEYRSEDAQLNRAIEYLLTGK